MKIGSGATPRGGQDAYRGGATALIRSQNVHNWGFSSDGLAFIDEQQADELSNVVVERSDVLLNITGDSVARCCMAPEEAFPARVNQHVLIIRTDPSVLHSRYLRYWMVAPTSQQHLLSLASAGATRNALTRAMVSDLRFDVPPLLEQRAIASVLGALDDKIDLNRRMCQTLEEMARALFKSWFVDFDPVRAKMQGRDPGLPKEMADLFPNRLVDSELGPIPEGWSVARLDDLASIRGGKQLPTERCRPVGDVPVFGANGIMGFTSEASHEGFVIAFGRVGAYCGSVHWSVRHAWINNNASAVVPLRWSVLLLSMMLHIDFAALRTGSAQPFIPNGSLAAARVIVPNEAIGDLFCRVVEPLRHRQAQLDNQSRTVAALRDTLLPKLIAGEVRVPASLGSMQEVAS